jgi:death-on-curing protein
VTQYLSLEDALIQVATLGFHVQDPGLLESALARPKASVAGKDAYPELSLKAAALLQSMIKNHSLLDGNKRSGWLLMVSFLFINGYRHDMNTQTAFDLTVGLADGRYDHFEAAELIEKHLVARASG